MSGQKTKTGVSVRLSIMMFVQFFIWGGYLVPMSKYLSSAFADVENLQGVIGNAYATNSIAAMLAPLVVGLIADRFFPGQVVMGVLHLLGGGLLFLAAGSTTAGGFVSGGFVTLMLLYSICYMPTLALVNSVSFDQLENPDKQFPAIRVWGTIGWIVSGVAVGTVLPKLVAADDPGATNIPFLMSAGASVLLGLYCFTLPNSPPKSRGSKVSLGKLVGLDALGMFRRPAFAVFALCSFLLCIPLAVYYAMANPFVAGAFRASESIMSLGQVSEIVFMVLLPFFLARFGVKTMLLGGMAAWVARYFLFAGSGGTVQWMILLGVLLHGICYDFFFVTGQLYTDKAAPRNIRASAQGLIALLTYGAGMFVGNQVFPRVANTLTADLPADAAFPWNAFWRFFGIAALVIMVLFAIAFRDKEKVGGGGTDA